MAHTSRKNEDEAKTYCAALHSGGDDHKGVTPSHRSREVPFPKHSISQLPNVGKKYQRGSQFDFVDNTALYGVKVLMFRCQCLQQLLNRLFYSGAGLLVVQEGTWPSSHGDTPEP